MRLALVMARTTAFLKDEGLSAFVVVRARFAGTQAAQPLACASAVRLRVVGAIRLSEPKRLSRSLLKRRWAELVELRVLLAQLAVLAGLMSLFVALLSVRG